MTKHIIPVLIIFISAFVLIPTASASCPEPVQGKYLGWQERYHNFTGGVGLGDSVTVEDFKIKVTRIIGDVGIEVTISKRSSDYLTSTIQVGEDNRLKDQKIMIELHNIIPPDRANITIYTPQRANLSVNLTNIDILTSESGRIELMPNEVFYAEFLLKNTGELDAKGITVTPQFGDFKIIDTDVKNISTLCSGGDTTSLEYTLKTPDVRKVFNYTLYLKLEYFDENIQTGKTGRYTEYYPVEIEIVPTVIEIERSTSNWTLTNPGRESRVMVTLNNTADTVAYNVEWSANIPPYLEVTRGTTSWNGSIYDRDTKIFYYHIISDDPIICQASSQVDYEDRFGNKYVSYSNNETIRFSPFLSIQKEIDGIPWLIDPTKNVMAGTTTWSIDPATWWKNRTRSGVINSTKEIWINRSAEVTVKIRNRGNAVARGVIVREILSGIEANGTTSWKGDLNPDEEATYSYTAKVVRHGNITLKTDASYMDVDPVSFKPPVDVQGTELKYCTNIPEEVKFNTKDRFYGLYHNITINHSSYTRVLGGAEFELNITIANNGSDSVRDVFTIINTSKLKVVEFEYGGEILKGQPYYYLPELEAGYYPDGSSRGLNQINKTYSLVLRAPDVDEDRVFTIVTTVNYTDPLGNTLSKNITTNITVVKAKPAYIIVTIEKKRLTVTPGAPKEIDIKDFGNAFIKLKSTGFAALDNLTISISVPAGMEIASNDTNWTGRIDAMLRMANDTWYWFSGDMNWNGSLDINEEKTIPFLVRGTRSGQYEIPFTIRYDGNVVTDSFNLLVKGPRLKITKSSDISKVNLSGYVNITVSVKNVGEDNALGIRITDTKPAAGFETIGNVTKEIAELKPGDEVSFSYRLKPNTEGSYNFDGATVKWFDMLGEEYQERSAGLGLEVVAAEKKIPGKGKGQPGHEVEGQSEDKGPEGLNLSRKQVIAVLIFSLLILGIIFKILVISRPIKKE